MTTKITISLEFTNGSGSLVISDVIRGLLVASDAESPAKMQVQLNCADEYAENIVEEIKTRLLVRPPGIIAKIKTTHDEEIDRMTVRSVTPIEHEIDRIAREAERRQRPTPPKRLDLPKEDYGDDGDMDESA